MATGLLGNVINRPPVDLSRRRSISLGLGNGADDPQERDLEMMGAVSTLFSVVDAIATDVAAARWNLYRGEGPTLEDDPDAELVDGPHPAKTLWNKPNPYTNGSEFREAAQQHYELTGEYWWVMSRSGALAGRRVRSPFPLEMWLVRPDRIRPVPDPERFLTGYLYRASGEEVALDVEDVIMNRRPSPIDPYRGLSPVGSLLYDLHGEKAAAAYNMAFFRNGAEPGGLIEVAEGEELDDNDWETLQRRWRETHQGVNNAHRVATIERGKWVPTTYTRKDMQFVDLRNFSKDTIREAYRVGKGVLGSETSSNRATHESERIQQAENIVNPRLRRMRTSANDDFLPMFGPLGEGYFFDFVDPSPEDKEHMLADRDSAVKAVATLVPMGFDVDETLEAFGLPALSYTPPAQQVEDNGNNASEPTVGEGE